MERYSVATHGHSLDLMHDDDDDVYSYIGERQELEGETENTGV